MTITETQGVPFVLDNNAVVAIDGIQLNCIVNHLVLKPDTAKVTATSMCGAVDYPGATKWVLGMTLYQSFQADGAFDVLQGAVDAGVPVDYLIRFHSGAASPTNPEFTGKAVPQPFDIVDSEAGALVTIQFEWGCTGPPDIDRGTATRAPSA